MKFLLCSLLIVSLFTISIDAQTSSTASNCTTCGMELSPLYHLVRHSDNYHFYIPTKDGADQSVSSYGFKYDVSPGMIALNALDCNCRASLEYPTRLYRPSTAENPIDEHVYTMDSDSIGNYINNLKYRWEGYEQYRFYCSSIPGSCGATVPLYSYILNGRHYLSTTTKGQGSATFDGVVCYIWPSLG